MLQVEKRHDSEDLVRSGLSASRIASNGEWNARCGLNARSDAVKILVLLAGVGNRDRLPNFGDIAWSQPGGKSLPALECRVEGLKQE